MSEELKDLYLKKRAIVHAFVEGQISRKEYIEKVTDIDNKIKRLEKIKGLR